MTFAVLEGDRHHLGIQHDADRAARHEDRHPARRTDGLQAAGAPSDAEPLRPRPRSVNAAGQPAGSPDHRPAASDRDRHHRDADAGPDAAHHDHRQTFRQRSRGRRDGVPHRHVAADRSNRAHPRHQQSGNGLVSDPNGRRARRLGLTRDPQHLRRPVQPAVHPAAAATDQHADADPPSRHRRRRGHDRTEPARRHRIPSATATARPSAGTSTTSARSTSRVSQSPGTTAIRSAPARRPPIHCWSSCWMGRGRPSRSRSPCRRSAATRSASRARATRPAQATAWADRLA